MKTYNGIKSVQMRVGARPFFEVVYYGPLAAYRVNDGRRHRQPSERATLRRRRPTTWG